MAANVRKVTALFKVDESGWSETYYFNSTDFPVSNAGINQFTRERRAVLGKQSTLISLRISQTANPGVTQLVNIFLNGTASAGANDNPDTDQASACLILPFRSSQGQRRNLTIRGVPDNWIKHVIPAVDIVVTGEGISGLNGFRDFLLEAPALAIRDRVLPPANPNLIVDTIALDVASGQYLITTTTPHSFVKGDRCVFLKMKGNNLQGTKGIRRVTGVGSTTTFLIDRGIRTDLGEIVYRGGGLVTKYVVDYFAASAVNSPYLISTRKAGRPFSQRRGRVSARR